MDQPPPRAGAFSLPFSQKRSFRGIPPKTGCAVFTGLCNGRRGTTSAAFRIQSVRMNGTTHQRNRRERPVCRSAPERTELFPIKPENVSHFCHSDRSVSGVEESTTLGNEPTQDKTGNSGRFLDSHSFARNDMSVGGSVQLHGIYLQRGMAMNHRRYIAWFHSTTQVIYGTSRAANNSRPYMRNTSAPAVPTMQNAARPSQSPAVTALPKGEPRSPFRHVLPLCPGEQRLDFLAVQSCKEQGRDDGGGHFRYGEGPPDHVHVSRQAQKIGYRQQHKHLAAQGDDG